MGLLSGDRRRRVLTEEVMGTHCESEVPKRKRGRGTTASGAPPYPPGTLRQVPSVADLLPRRYLTVGLWFVAMGGIAAGIVAAGHVLPGSSVPLAGASANVLKTTGPGTLASWYGSTLLLLAAGVSLAIFSLRRHKTDDFKGRYRIWIWAAMTWLVMSINAVARVHLVVSDLAVSLTGWSGWLGPAFWWVLPAALAVGFIFLRLVVEMRSSRLAVFALLLTGGCSAGALAAHLEALPAQTAIPAGLVQPTLTLAAHVLLLTSLGLYARRVVLEASGKLAASTPRKKDSSEGKTKHTRRSQAEENSAASEKSSKSGRRRHRVDPAHRSSSDDRNNGSAPTTRKRKQNNKQQEPATEWVDGSEPEANAYADDAPGGRERRLSKAERKRLRKQRSREARAARS